MRSDKSRRERQFCSLLIRKVSSSSVDAAKKTPAWSAADDEICSRESLGYTERVFQFSDFEKIHLSVVFFFFSRRALEGFDFERCRKNEVFLFQYRMFKFFIKIYDRFNMNN